jgi:dihydroneopterin aldolase
VPDTIVIRELEVWYHVGVPDAERADPQRLLLNIEMVHDFTAAAASDDLGATIDYFAVAQRLLTFGQQRSWKLIEKLATDLAAMILSEFAPASVAVEVRKFIIPEARYVAVKTTLARKR